MLEIEIIRPLFKQYNIEDVLDRIKRFLLNPIKCICTISEIKSNVTQYNNDLYANFAFSRVNCVLDINVYQMSFSDIMYLIISNQIQYERSIRSNGEYPILCISNEFYTFLIDKIKELSDESYPYFRLTHFTHRSVCFNLYINLTNAELTNIEANQTIIQMKEKLLLQFKTDSLVKPERLDIFFCKYLNHKAYIYRDKTMNITDTNRHIMHYYNNRITPDINLSCNLWIDIIKINEH